jgi:hypothetical protein
MFPGEEIPGTDSDTNNEPIPRSSPFSLSIGAPAHNPFGGVVKIGLSKKYSHQPVKGRRETDLTIEPTPRFGEGNINKCCLELISSELPSCRGGILRGTTDLMIPNPEVWS